MVQTLCEQDVPPTQIAQLSGHKNLKSIENYSSVSTRQQMYMSNVLSSLVAGTSSSSVEETCVSTSCDSTAGKHVISLFGGAVIQGGNFSININTLNQSPTLSVDSSSPVEKKAWKRLKTLDSDSDN